MYLDYLKNGKFTSPTTLPLINFMQRSLVELYSLDTTITYQHGFVFLRQLAVHLRTAIQNKKPVSLISSILHLIISFFFFRKVFKVFTTGNLFMH